MESQDAKSSSIKAKVDQEPVKGRERREGRGRKVEGRRSEGLLTGLLSTVHAQLLESSRSENGSTPVRRNEEEQGRFRCPSLHWQTEVS